MPAKFYPNFVAVMIRLMILQQEERMFKTVAQWMQTGMVELTDESLWKGEHRIRDQFIKFTA